MILALMRTAVVTGFLLVACLAQAEVLLDETWADGSRKESRRPAEAAVWVGREEDLTVRPKKFSVRMTPASQKIWTYFTEKEPVTLKVGQKLKASIAFVPREVLSETTSRSFRIGLFHDPTDQRVETDVNSDAGGDKAPWTDAKGYAVQVLLAGGEYPSTKPFDLGKRTNLQSKSLLGTSADYAKVSGGTPVALELDKEYTVTLQINRLSESEVELTASYRQGKEELSSWSVVDDGSYLGTEGVYDKFDLLFIRISDGATTADRIDLTNFKVELAKAETTD